MSILEALLIVAPRTRGPGQIQKLGDCTLPTLGSQIAWPVSNGHPRLQMTLFSCSVRALATS